MQLSVVSVLAGVSSLAGLLAILSYFYLTLGRSRVERSVREVVEGEGLFNSQQIISILAKFESDAMRLQALEKLANLDTQKATKLLNKVERKIDVNQLSSSASRTHERRLLIAAIFFIVIAVAAVALNFQSKALETPETGTEDDAPRDDAPRDDAPRSDVAYLSEAVRSAMSAPTGCLPNTASYEHCLSFTQQHREYLLNAELTFTQLMSGIPQNMGCIYWDQATQLKPQSSNAQRETALRDTYVLIRQLEQLAGSLYPETGDPKAPGRSLFTSISEYRKRDPAFLTMGNIHESFDQLFRPQTSGTTVKFSAFEGDLGRRRAAEFSQYLLGQCQKLLDDEKCSRNCFNTTP